MYSTVATVDAEVLLNKIVDVARKNPDVVYIRSDDCFYAPDANNPCGCLIGCALSQLGVDVEALDEFHSGEHLGSETFKSLVEHNVVVLLGEPLENGQALDIINRIQNRQDSGEHNWKDCVNLGFTDQGRLPPLKETQNVS